MFSHFLLFFFPPKEALVRAPSPRALVSRQAVLGGPRGGRGAGRSHEEAAKLGLQVVPHLAHLLVPLDPGVDPEDVGIERQVDVDQLRLLVQAVRRAVAAELLAWIAFSCSTMRDSSCPTDSDSGARLCAAALPIRLFVRLYLSSLVQRALLVPLQQVQEEVRLLHRIVLLLSALLRGLVSQQREPPPPDRPFSACLRDPHVPLFGEAQEGSGIVSDPRALSSFPNMRRSAALSMVRDTIRSARSRSL